jgi:hypothetical protein
MKNMKIIFGILLTMDSVSELVVMYFKTLFKVINQLVVDIRKMACSQSALNIPTVRLSS